MSTISSPRSSRLRSIALALAVTGVITAVPAVGQETQIQPEAARQIALLLGEKAARSPAQEKIDSRLLMTQARQRDDALLAALPALRTRVGLQPDGRVRVDVRGVVDDALVVQVQALGGTVVNAHPRFGTLRADLPLAALEAFASLPAVHSIRPAERMITQMTNTTEGDVAHGADTARTTFGVDGSGVRACAMSDSVDALAALQASGDLPAGVTVLAGQSGNPGTSEGTALLEIIHDMAPGAELFFATGSGGQGQMAQNILDLAAAGCDVIVDDVLYLAEAVFQDGIVAQAVEEVVADGVTYFTSAGNSGNLAAGTAGVFEGAYTPTALPAPLTGAALSAHDFGGGDPGNSITFDPPVLITMQWANPLGAADDDYDLFLLDPTLSTVLAASTNVQNGTQDPLEFIESITDDDTNNRLVVALFDGDPRFFHLNTHRGMLATATDGQIFGHPAAEGAITVAAVNVASAGGGPFTGGGANPPEPFTSDGPRRIFFEADGTPIPAASDSGTLAAGGAGGTVRQKPDIAAADGVSTATPGFNPFFGTSASAPHGSGLAALLEELLGSLCPSGVKSRLTKDALDNGMTGDDNVTGKGIPLADLTLDGPLGFQNDIFDFLIKLCNSLGCFSEHQSGMGDNDATFDGDAENLDSYTNGTTPMVTESQSNPEDDTRTTEINIQSQDGSDLFPEGFTDPDTGTPLNDGGFEIGTDNALNGDMPVSVTSAIVNMFNDGNNVFTADITSAFSEPWNGSVSVNFPGLAGQGINEINLDLEMVPNPAPIFSDGFESGNTSSWTDSAP